MKIKSSLAIFLIPALLLGWILLSRVSPSEVSASTLEAPRENFLAPDFVLTGLDGTELTLSDLQGQPIILNFWASWCPPCRAEMPAFQEAWLEFGGSDLRIIAVNATRQDSLSEINRFLNEVQIEFPILLDPDGYITSAYQVHSLPTTYFINRSGIITDVLIGGPIPLSLLRIQAGQLLQE